jgi:hypothetical protein
MKLQPLSSGPGLLTESEEAGERCELCRFWRQAAAETQPKQPGASDPIVFGICCRYPPFMSSKPSVHPISGQPQKDAAGQIIVSPFPMWPITGNVEWCGEFKSETAVPASRQ